MRVFSFCPDGKPLNFKTVLRSATCCKVWYKVSNVTLQGLRQGSKCRLWYTVLLPGRSPRSLCLQGRQLQCISACVCYGSDWSDSFISSQCHYEQLNFSRLILYYNNTMNSDQNSSKLTDKIGALYCQNHFVSVRFIFFFDDVRSAAVARSYTSNIGG